MGKVLKVVAGAALLYFSGGLAAGILGAAAGATSLTILATAIQLAGSMLLASALAPNLGDSTIDGQGQSLQTRKSNVNTVPVVYGKNKIAGNIVYQYTNNYSGGSTNVDYWAIIAMSDGEMNEFISMYSNDMTMDSKGSGVFTLEFTHIKATNTSGSGVTVNDVYFATDQAGTTVQGSTIFNTISPTVSSGANSGNLVDGDLSTSWIPTSVDDEWIKILDGDTATATSASVNIPDKNNGGDEHTINFRLQYSDNDSTWINASENYSNKEGYDQSWVKIISTETDSHDYWRIFFTDISYYDGDSTYASKVYEVAADTSYAVMATLPENISFIAVHELYDATDNPQINNITTIARGREMEYFELPHESPMSEAYSDNPAVIVYDILKNGLGISEDDIDTRSFYDGQVHCSANVLRCNIVYIRQENMSAAVQAALATMRGYIVFSDSKWVLIFDAPKQSIATLTTDDFLNSTMSVSMKRNEDIANKITLKYVNPDDEWQVASVERKDDDLIDLDGQIIEKVVEVRGCTSELQADKLAEIMLNRMRYSEDSAGDRIKQTPLSISFSTSIKNIHLEVGDVITLQHDILEFDRKMTIGSIETDQSGAVHISGEEYCETHYQKQDETYLIF